jgi:hypothetical protein
MAMDQRGDRPPAPRHALREAVPDPWRGWLTARSARRWLRAVRFARSHNAALAPDAPRLATFPMRLEPTAALAHVARRLGWRIVGIDDAPDLAVAWDRGTLLRPADAARLPADAINARCTDISKSTVDRVWAEVAGYSIAVDPLTTRGPLVVKPEQNGVRGGRVVKGPLPRRQPGFVYQRLIDTRSGERILATRAVIIDGRIVHAYEKWRLYPGWFSRDEKSAPAAASIYNPDEQALLLEFAERIALDYGEVDVLRENGTGRIFVVDANRTPVRPSQLPPERSDEVFGPQAAAWQQLLDRRRATPASAT